MLNKSPNVNFIKNQENEFNFGCEGSRVQMGFWGDFRTAKERLKEITREGFMG